MRTAQRIDRIEHTLGTLITWLAYNGLRPDEAEKLLAMLKEAE